MRQGQNPKRARGRGGRRPQNQINRTMDSNGPDVKIRGTAQHIFEKYQALARDAQSSGDRIGSENYLQHAEHYFRLILQFQAQNGDDARQQGDNRRSQDADNGGDEDGADDEQPRAARQDRAQQDRPQQDRQEKAAKSQQGPAEAGDGQSGDKAADKGGDRGSETSDEAAASAEGDQPKRRAPRRRRAPRQTSEEGGGAASGEGGDQTPAEAAQ